MANIESNPNVSVMVEDGSTMADIRGVMIQGRARIVRESGEALELARAGARARGVPESEWPTAPRPGAAYIRVTPVRTLSWDYGTPDVRPGGLAAVQRSGTSVRNTPIVDHFGDDG